MRLRSMVIPFVVLLAAAGVLAVFGPDQAREASHLAGYIWSN
ncbi:hypothetical protein [Polymorphospora sp. NPDC050346]